MLTWTSFVSVLNSVYITHLSNVYNKFCPGLNMVDSKRDTPVTTSVASGTQDRLDGWFLLGNAGWVLPQHHCFLHTMTTRLEMISLDI